MVGQRDVILDQVYLDLRSFGDGGVLAFLFER